jgi:hypothetical protein
MTQHTEQEVKPCKFVNGACIHCEATEQGDCQGFVCDDSLYASYTKREWVGLTDEDKKKIATAAGCTEDDDGHIVTEIFRLAEAKLKERNT